MIEHLRPFFFHGDKRSRSERRALLSLAKKGDLTSAYHLAKRAYADDDFELAQKYFKKVCKGPSEHWFKASLYLGTIEFNKNQFAAAEFFWRQAADSGEPTSMYNLGILYKQNGDIPSSMHWFERAWLKGHPRAKVAFENLKSIPAPQFNLSPRDAELLAAKWMVYWGYFDAAATPIGPDGGIDVRASGALAQVKYRNVKTSRSEINEFHGSAEGTGKDELFFSLSGYTQNAIQRANDKSIALFIFGTDGTPRALNATAKKVAGTLI